MESARHKMWHRAQDFSSSQLIEKFDLFERCVAVGQSKFVLSKNSAMLLEGRGLFRLKHIRKARPEDAWC